MAHNVQQGLHENRRNPTTRTTRTGKFRPGTFVRCSAGADVARAVPRGSSESENERRDALRILAPKLTSFAKILFSRLLKCSLISWLPAAAETTDSPPGNSELNFVIWPWGFSSNILTQGKPTRTFLGYGTLAESPSSLANSMKSLDKFNGSSCIFQDELCIAYS